MRLLNSGLMRGGCTALLFSSLAAAQTNDSIRVLVQDQTGLPIVGAVVTAAALPSGRCTTDQTGHCTVERQGSRNLDVTAQGFAPRHVIIVEHATASTVTMAAHSNTLVNVYAIADRPRGAQERVSITAEEIDRLPVWLRTTDSLVSMAPGTVTRPTDDEWGQGVSAAGTRLTMTNSTLDGMPNRAERRGGLALRPSLDSLTKIDVLTSGYSAEYGHTPGAQVVMTTRSGSDEFHGALYNYARDRIGGMLGGRLRRGKSYFFLSYEGNSTDYGSPVTSAVPTSSELSGNFSSVSTPLRVPIAGQNSPPQFSGNVIPAAKISPLAQKLLPLIPASATGSATNEGEHSRDRQALLRFDLQTSARSRLMLRVGRTNSAAVLEPYAQEGLPASWPANRDVANSLAASYDRERGQTALTLRASYLDTNGSSAGSCHNDQRYSVTLANSSPTTGCPIVSIAGFQTFGDAFHLYNYRSRTTELAGNLSTQHGRNALKLGVAATKASYWQQDPTEENGYLSFSGQYTGNAVADFLLGMPATAIRVLGPVASPGSLHPDNFSGYVQDSLRVAESFTLDLGARIEYLPRMVTNSSNLTSFWPQFGAVVGGAQQPLLRSAGVNVSPRLGFSWHPFGKNTVIRGGAGKFIGEDDLASTLGQLTGVQAPRSAVVSPSTPAVINPFNPVWSPISNTVTRGIDPRNLVPLVYQYTLVVQRQLPGGLLAEASYIGSRGEHLGRLYNVNQSLPTGVLDSSRNPILVRQYANLGDVLYEDHGASSRYNAGRMAIRKQSGTRVTLNLVYTFSKSIDDASAVFERNWSSMPQAQDSRHLNLERGLSDFDHRQQLTGFATVRLDGFSHSAVLRRSTIALAATVMSGQPFTVLLNDDLRPDLVGNPYQGMPAGYYINPAAFVAHVPTPSRPDYFGDLGRNSLIGPYFNTIDVAFNKGFRMKRAEIDLRVEVFNVADRAVPFIGNYLGPGLGTARNTLNQGRLVIAGGRVSF